MRKVAVASILCVLAVASSVWAQSPPRHPSVGILNYGTALDTRVQQFRNALRDLGHNEGKDLNVIYRGADGDLERLPDLAAELVDRNVDVIIALGPAVWAARRATSTVPIVIAFSGDPVGDGVVPRLARPGGNITGFSYMSTELAAKRLELVSKLFAKRGQIAILYNPDEPATRLEMRETEAAASRLSVTVKKLPVRHAKELGQAFAEATTQQADAVVVFTHGFAVLNRTLIIELAARHRLPTLYGWRDFVDDGGLISYGPDIEVLVRQAASYVDRILKGTSAGDLPVQRPTRFDLSINLKAAREQELSFPEWALNRADHIVAE